MLKVDKIKRLFDCDLCNKLLSDPVALPCGYTICQSHVNELLERRFKAPSTFVCELCEDDHVVPANGFVLNKKFKSALDIELNRFKIDIEVYDECKMTLETALAKYTELHGMVTDSDNYISEYFERIKRDVNFRRDELKLKIDTYSDETLQSIEKSKQCLIKLSKEVNQLIEDIHSSKKDLDTLNEHFDTFEIDYGNLENIKIESDILNKKYNKWAVEYKEKLLRHKKYSFEYEDKSVEEFFGRFEEKLFNDSKILEPHQQQELANLCEFKRDQIWELKYRASRDGFKSTDFHSNCDGLTKTLTVIKTTNGYIFGGFTEQAWHSNGGYEKDPKAFIYSLINYENSPFKVMNSNDGEFAIDCSLKHGPSFGGNNEYMGDIVIKSDSNINEESFSDFGCSYKHPEYKYDSDEVDFILAGSFKFQTVDIEVFKITN